jgi:hypothetical protein
LTALDVSQGAYYMFRHNMDLTTRVVINYQVKDLFIQCLGHFNRVPLELVLDVMTAGRCLETHHISDRAWEYVDFGGRCTFNGEQTYAWCWSGLQRLKV